MYRRGSVSLVVLLATACGDEPGREQTCASVETNQPIVRWAEPSQLDDLVAHPWPSDALLIDDGRVRLSHFPNPTGSSTLQDYLQIFRAELRGFATSAASYLGFSEPMDPTSFPSDPGVALQDDAPVMLIDIDPDSPERGRRYPLRLQYRSAATVYLPSSHLAVLAPFGATLRGGTAYALLLTDAVRAASGARLARSTDFSNALRPACADRTAPALAAVGRRLEAWLDTQVDAERFVGGTVFTTRDVVTDIRALADAARSVPVVDATNWVAREPTAAALEFEAQVELPSFQNGRAPYASVADGGALVRTTDGFQLDHRETTRLGVAIPRRQPMPAGGWPVVLYSHGTGGDYDSVFRSTVSEVLAENGLASVGYDGVLHGPRDPTNANPELTFFNLFNPVAARDNVLQGAADLVALTEILQTLEVPATVATTAQRFDPDRLAVLGHSQGALVGAPMVAADARPRAVVFSGLGTILTITLLERQDPVDFRALMTSLLGLPAQEPVDDFHPVLNLLQQFIEPADPIAYARSYTEDPPAGAPTSVLMVEGFLDFASPARGQEAFSVAAKLPVVEPVERVPEAATWLGASTVTPPVRGNVRIATGTATFGLVQYPDESHFPIFRNSDANRRYVSFLRSALIGAGAEILAPQ